jgi:tRNA threonylcarbamoyladenosine biosynthesis protein TsaB
MLLLAIDTSTRQSSVSLSTENELHGEYTWHAENNHSVELLENIRRIMAECQLSMPQLNAIAVATGPGSFNGVRVALATAKTLAFALSIPLVGISTLDALAVQQMWGGSICALLEAGRGELYAATYRCEQVSGEDGSIDNQLRRLSDYLLVTPTQLASSFLQYPETDRRDRENVVPPSVSYTMSHSPSGLLPGSSGNTSGELGDNKLDRVVRRKSTPVLFCGELSTTSRQALQTAMRGECLFANAVCSARRASMMAMLAMPRLRAGKIDDPLLLEPLYLRRPSITTSSRKQPLLGGVSQQQGQRKTEREEGALRH